MDACKEGQCATTRVNASNEVAVEAFLEGKIQFCDIAKVNDATLNAMPHVSVSSIQQILEQDSLARAKANVEENSSASIFMEPWCIHCCPRYFGCCT